MFYSKDLKPMHFSSFAEAAKEERRKQAMKVDVAPEKIAKIKEFFAMGGTMPPNAMREAIGVGPWDSIMLDAMYKRLLKGWGAVNETLMWRNLVSYFKPVSDFRTQYALQMGDFTTLDVVPEKGEYHNAEMTDDRVSYSVSKYGKLFGTSYETATNDDLGALGNIAQRFGKASARTVDKFVMKTLINDNANIYDGNALFLAAGTRSQSNLLGASKALSHDNLEAACKLMATFTDLDSNPLNIEPKYLLVHPDEKYEAMRILNTNNRPSTGNNDINVHYGSLELIVSRYVTSSYWYIIADPSAIDTIELGFLGGREQPEVFEENADSGHAFAYDEKRYKCRVVFGGAITDWRGFVGCNFA